MGTNENIDRIEVIFAVILLFTTVTSAFCAYEATRWAGARNSLVDTSNRLTTESIRASDEANRDVLVDVSVFLSWVDAKSRNDTLRAGFLESRFTPEFTPAFDAWIAAVKNGTPGTIPPGTPFSRPEYHVFAQDRSGQLQQNASAIYNEAKEASQTSDDYILNAVLFTIVLFLCGVGQRWEHDRIRKILLVSAIIFFIIAMGVFLWLPKNIGF
jgi:hypothetical protein